MKKLIITALFLYFIFALLQTEGSIPQNQYKSLNMKINFLLDTGYVAYISFPYGGSLLIDTGDKTHRLELVKELKKVIFKGDKIYKILSFLGWKPRIDWLILSNYSPKRIGGAKVILRNFRVTHIFTTFCFRKNGEENIVSNPLVGELFFELGFKNKIPTPLSSKKKIDIFQGGVSNLNLKVLYPFTPATSSGDSNICLRLDYGKIRILFISELTDDQQRQLLTNIPDELHADILYHPPGLGKKFIDVVNASYAFSLGNSRTLVTDGKKIEFIAAETK